MRTPVRIIEGGGMAAEQLSFSFPAEVEWLQFPDARQLSFEFMNPWKAIGNLLGEFVREEMMRQSFMRQLFHIQPLRNGDTFELDFATNDSHHTPTLPAPISVSLNPPEPRSKVSGNGYVRGNVYRAGEPHFIGRFRQLDFARRAEEPGDE
jgi:hypothetical protein